MLLLKAQTVQTRRIQVGAERIAVTLRTESVRSEPVPDGVIGRRTDQGLELTYDVCLKRRQGALILEGPGGPPSPPKIDRALVRAYCLARDWAQRLARGDTFKQIAQADSLCEHYIARLTPLAFLAPDLAEQILRGRQPPAISLAALIKQPLPMDWTDQRRRFAAIGRHAG